jgi:predicted patatin/cPLA2 family phospholipase
MTRDESAGTSGVAVSGLHPVADLIRARHRCASKPGRRDDGAKLGLVIEGGGIRGVISCGMATALDYLGVTETFDAVYGSSAGAVNGAYLLSGQSALGTHAYYEDINTNAFASYWRALGRKPIVNLEYLYEDVVIGAKPLFSDGVLESPIPLRIVASDVDRLTWCVLPYRDAPSLRRALHCSARMPIVAGGPLEYDGTRYYDAMIFQPIPLEVALGDGCTHVLVLLTRPRAGSRREPGFVEKHFIAPQLERIREGLGVAYLTRGRRYRAIRERIFAAEEAHEGLPQILAVAPPASAAISNLEKRRSRLLHAGAAGMSAAVMAIAGVEVITHEVLMPFTNKGVLPRL